MSNHASIAFFCALVFSFSCESALAKTVEISTYRSDHAPYSAYGGGGLHDQQRSRYDLGSDWTDGSATLTVTVSWNDMSYPTTFIPVGVGMASSINSAFMTPTKLTPNSSDEFATNTLSDDSLGGFVSIRDITSLPSNNVVADIANQKLTFTFNPVLQSGAHYYLFMDFFDPYLPTYLPTKITLSQVPLPASSWLLISGLAGLATASRRRKSLPAF